MSFPLHSFFSLSTLLAPRPTLPSRTHPTSAQSTKEVDAQKPKNEEREAQWQTEVHIAILQVVGLLVAEVPLLTLLPSTAVRALQHRCAFDT